MMIDALAAGSRTRAIAAVVIVFGFALSAVAQTITTGTIEGVVTAPTRGALPGATVVVRHMDTNVARELVTDDGGRYGAGALQPGRYEVTATLSGFEAEPLSNIDVVVGQTAPVDIRMQPAGRAPRPTLTGLAHDVLRDQGFLWSRPFRLNRSDLPWTVGLLGTAGGLIATDRRVGQELSGTPPGDLFRFGRRVSHIGGGAGDLSVASAFYVVGRLAGNERARTTGVLGLRALADALIVVESLKTVAQRPRPTRDGGRVRVHNADGEFFTGGRSFPSGHAIQGWALATVVACRYPDRRWVAPVAYSLAGFVSVARTLHRQHFPGDTFVGGSIGFMIGRHVCHSASSSSASSTSPPSHRWLFSGSALGTRGAAFALTRAF